MDDIYTQINEKITKYWTLWVILGFLAIAKIAYFVMLGMSGSSIQTGEAKMSQLIDIFTLVIFGITMFVYLIIYDTDQKDMNDFISDNLKRFENYLNDSYSILHLMLFLIGFYLVIYFLKIPMNENKALSVMIIENVTIILFVMILIIDFFKIFFNIRLVDILLTDGIIAQWNKFIGFTTISRSPTPTSTLSNRTTQNVGATSTPTPTNNGGSSSNIFVFLYNWFISLFSPSPMKATVKPTLSATTGVPTMSATTGVPTLSATTFPTENFENIDDFTMNAPTDEYTNNFSETDIATDSIPSTEKDEVFNISNNVYTYEDAKNVCSIYGAKLATYDQVEDAYKDGAEWCNYGWSKDQMVFYPTQKDTYAKLQENPFTANMCGRPGVNGGFIEDPTLEFGVNCYGVKPTPSPGDLNNMQQNNLPDFSLIDPITKSKIDYWKKNPNEFLNLKSFNYNKWSEHL